MVSRLCVAGRKASRKIWRLSPRTHCDILPLLSDCVPLDISLKQRFMKFIQKAFNHTSPLISSIAKLAMCNPWSRSASNYSEIFSDNNGRGTLCPSDIGNKWKANVSVARMNDVHILREMIEIRDGFKECCILSKEDVSDIIDKLTIFLLILYIFFTMCHCICAIIKILLLLYQDFVEIQRGLHVSLCQTLWHNQ